MGSNNLNPHLPTAGGILPIAQNPTLCIINYLFCILKLDRKRQLYPIITRKLYFQMPPGGIFGAIHEEIVIIVNLWKQKNPSPWGKRNILNCFKEKKTADFDSSLGGRKGR